MSNQHSDLVSEEELAFLEASVDLDRLWDGMRHLVLTNAPYAAIDAMITKCIEFDHRKHSLYRCWKENHPNRYEDGSISFGMGGINDTTCERCADCGRVVKPRSTKLPEIPGNEIPDIP